MTGLASLVLLYAVMLWPARYAFYGLFAEWYYPQIIYETGVWTIYLLLVTLSVSPVLTLLNRVGRGRSLGRWLLQNRRHFGLGSFIHASLHVMHYTIETNSASWMLNEAVSIEYFVAWIAFVILALLAVTSNSYFARRLGRRWKKLHIWIYPAVLLSLAHWYFFDYTEERFILLGGCFIALKLAHLGLRRLPRRAAQS